MNRTIKGRKPPKTAVWLIKRLFPDETSLYTHLGDLEEAFNKISNEQNPLFAQVWYWMNALRSIPYSLIRSLSWSCIMIKNYLKIALRNFFKYKTSSIINILGLSIGLAVCILIYLFIKDEFSYDRFHKNSDSIYSIVTNNHFFDYSHRNSPVPLPQLLKEHFPEIENSVRMIKKINMAVNYKEKIFNETITLTDPQIFEVFSFPLKKGAPESILQSTNSVVLTQSAANKYFGTEDPLGKILSFSSGQRQKNFEVSGILEDVPANSTIQFSILININNLNFFTGADSMENWTSSSSRSYILLKHGSDPQNIEKNILGITKPHLALLYEKLKKYGQLKEDGETITYSLQNIKDMHLHSANIYGAPRSDIKKSFILAGIALLILTIALINFINMSIGRSSVRAVEVGIRKVVGAGKKQLLYQFWGESAVISLISLVLGLIFVLLMLPAFNSLSDKNLTSQSLYYVENLAVFLFIVLFMGVAGGSFPGLVMANFKTKEILSGKFNLKRKNIFTKILVIVQFSLSIFFLIGSLLMSKQIRFINNYDLGFEKHGVLIVDMQERDNAKSLNFLKLFKERIQSHPAVDSVSGCLSTPYRTDLYSLIDIKGKKFNVYYSRVYFDYIDTMKMELIDGRDFSSEFSSEASSAIVNQKLLDLMGLEQPVGKTLKLEGERSFTIIGVIKNFNYSSLEDEIDPVVLNMDPKLGIFYTLIRISSVNLMETITFLEENWKEIQPNRPFIYSFLDDDIQLFYKDENRWNTIVNYSSVFTILIACLGVIGLTLITINYRIKEIGIRKVFGASIYNILKLISREFVLFVLIAGILAIPVAWFVMNQWLQSFAYRANMNVWVFLIPGVITAIIALLTSCVLAFKAATTNPIDSIRYE